MEKKHSSGKKYCSIFVYCRFFFTAMEKILQWILQGEKNTVGRKYCSGKNTAEKENTAMGKNTAVNTAGRRKILWGGGGNTAGEKIQLWKKYCSEYCREKENTAGGRGGILQGKNTVGRKYGSGKKNTAMKKNGKKNTAGRKKILPGNNTSAYQPNAFPLGQTCLTLQRKIGLQVVSRWMCHELVN